ncbi:hypothetical protein [Pelagicoccus sp. SDUM812002]|uniref:exopolysaccharide transport family protein n=1 Tax=Pelagicoccus sp. SDUM812002 TaxID=3041266 RepID=UPI00280DB358|nr:hypothetical protein [Pelagicoccus sp. SDUM812002]MDQ8188066.1 hypothetical protein [Pelagicoccus sp. SDUM812002]
MNNLAPNNQSSGLKLSPGDIIYTLFRHSKKILFFFVLGLGVGAAIYKEWPKMYESRATIMIKFITEDRTMNAEQNTQVVNTGGRGSGHIIAAERTILSSLDLAKTVAERVGPDRLVTKIDAEKTVQNAAGAILGGLTVENPGSTSMLEIKFQHESPAVAANTLETLISSYLDRHHEIHRKSPEFDGFLTRETDQMRTRLQQTEKELQLAKSTVGVIDIDAAKMRLADDMDQVRDQILAGKTELAELSIYLDREKEINEASQPKAATNDSTTPITSRDKAREIAAAMDKYAAVQQKVDLLKKREQTLSLQYTDENSLLKSTRSQITKSETELNDLRLQYPQFEAIAFNELNEDAGSPPVLNSQEYELRSVALKARLRTLESILDEMRAEAKKLDIAEISVNELQRRKELQEANYRGLLASMEQVRVQDELMDGRVNNITILQSPTPAYPAINQKIQIAGGVGGGIAVLGLLWAFLTDLVFDRSIKRPTEIQRNLGIPLFMSLPDMKSKRFRKLGRSPNRRQLQQAGRAKQLKSSKKEQYEPTTTTLKAAAISKPDEYNQGKGPEVHTIAPWEEEHALSGHFDALRDKVITYFESKNLTHKPKLIAMTGLGESSGVTTIASGLAGSLSKIGEGSVLLVDMTLGSETAQQFYNGKNILNLDDVLDSADDAKIENNLYVVAEGSNGVKLPRIMPQRFNKIMPKLRASDFDYIVFDMPPVSPISSTPRLASFMDVVLMVMESEETNRDVANQALELLSESRAHLGGILNKTKSHVPKKLEQDLLSQS